MAKKERNNKMNKAEILWKALDTLRERGMAKHVLEVGFGEGQVCARGACHVAMTGNARWPTWWRNRQQVGAEEMRDLYKEIEKDLLATADELFPCNFTFSSGYRTWFDIARFNNHPNTTPEMLEAVFEKTAIRAEEGVSA
jgi:hypothetical protein